MADETDLDDGFTVVRSKQRFDAKSIEKKVNLIAPPIPVIEVESSMTKHSPSR